MRSRSCSGKAPKGEGGGEGGGRLLVRFGGG